MFSISTLNDYLQKANPYPCLNILESAVVCSRRKRKGAIPAPIFDDLAAMFGRETVEAEIGNLEKMGALVRTKTGFSLNGEALPLISGQLDQYKREMKLELAGRELSAGIFLEELVGYLKREVPFLTVAEAVDGISCLLEWQDNRYRLQLAFSSAWLPAAAEEAAADRIYTAVFGPFAAQNWQRMFLYYKYPEFRNLTAYYDPWHRQKLNISKGGLFTHFDWFFRDSYGLKFFIPEEFAEMLQDLGLLRYNDEK